MSKDSSFHDYVVYDLLGDMPDITSKAMFGGWALYEGGVIFGIIVDGELYFKVGESNRKDFEKLDSHPFTYAKKDGKTITMSYWLVPGDVLEDSDLLHDLLETSLAVSRQ